MQPVPKAAYRSDFRENTNFCPQRDSNLGPLALQTSVLPLDHCDQDASDHTVSGALAQTGEDGEEHPIAFTSQKLNKTQRNWATVEKAAYAALCALRKMGIWCKDKCLVRSQSTYLLN